MDKNKLKIEVGKRFIERLGKIVGRTMREEKVSLLTDREVKEVINEVFKKMVELYK